MSVSSTTISPPCQGSVRPADRADAKNRTSVTGNSPLGQQGPHDPADLTGGPEYSYTHGLQPKTCR